MNRFPHVLLLLRRACVRTAVSLLGGGKGGRFTRPGSFVQRWLRRRIRQGIYVRVAPHESAIVREKRYYVTYWTPLCGLNLRRSK